MQNKHIKILIVSFLLFLSYLGAVPVTSNNDLTAGTSFEYKVNKYQVDATINDASQSYTTFTIAGSPQITPGSSDAVFNIIYTGSDTSSVSYTMSKDVYNQSEVIYSNDPFSLLSSSSSSGFPTESILSTANNDLASSTLPFILPVSGTSDQLWSTLDTVTFADVHLSGNQNGLSASEDIKSTITSDHFEVSLSLKGKGTINGQTIDLNVATNLVYDLATGVLLGYKTNVKVDETISGSTYHASIISEITRSDYHFSSSGVFGFEYMPFIFSMFMVSIIILKLRKNRIVK